VPRPLRIVSGGQTGVDRAALDVAIALGIPHGGWCPRGRRAEDGPIAARYAMQEHTSADYDARTEANVVDSDGTLILYRGALEGGTKLTRELAERHRKALFVVELGEAPDPVAVRRWIDGERIAVLNVAGPRESGRRGICREAREFLTRVLGADG
jgi:hypothetical protein